MKKFSFLIAASVAFSVALPAMATASTGLTSPEGTLVPVGTTFVAPSTTSVTFEGTGVGTYSCKQMVLKGKVIKNAATGIEANSSGETSTASTCFLNGTTAVTVDTISIEQLLSASTEPSSGKFTASYVTHTGSLNCKYKLTNVKLTYENKKDLFSLTKQPQTVTPAACGSGGTLTATFTLEKTTKAPILIMS